MLIQLPPIPKPHIDQESVSLIYEIDKKLIQLDGLIKYLPDISDLITLLQTAELINNYNLEHSEESSLKSIDYYLGDIKTKKIILGINSAMLLGERLIKNVSSSSHIINSIHNELVRGGVVDMRESVNGVEIRESMIELEKYISMNISYPEIINGALIHAQFLINNPYGGGNGIVSRLLFHLHLIWKEKLSTAIIPISAELIKNKMEFKDRLDDIRRNNNWSGWIKFFLKRVNNAVSRGLEMFKAIYSIRYQLNEKLLEKDLLTNVSTNIIKEIIRKPYFTIPEITKSLGYSKQTVNFIIGNLMREDVIEEITGKQRYRIYVQKDIAEVVRR